MIQYKVCVVIVTYGARWKFLNQVLTRVISFNNVFHIIVVNNASCYNLEDQITNPKVFVLNNVENEGSAGGYNRGISYAYNSVDCNFIWLLDDDNLPAENALDELFKHWETIIGENDQKALFCFRPDRQAHINIARGTNPEMYYLVPDNFLGFSLTRMFKNQLRKIKGKFKSSQKLPSNAVMPYVPYGGLIMHRQLITKIGFPNSDFYLYVDDSEYTYRITRTGAKIYLIPSAGVMDIDISQGINYKKSLFRSQLLDLWNFRTYYHVRNRIYFYSLVATRNKFMFSVNKVLYLGWLWIVSIIIDKKDIYRKLVGAVNDGLSGKLGKAGQDKF